MWPRQIRRWRYDAHQPGRRSERSRQMLAQRRPARAGGPVSPGGYGTGAWWSAWPWPPAPAARGSPARPRPDSAPSGPRITVDMVTHGQAFDPFWALVKKGAQTAATDFNVNLVYQLPLHHRIRRNEASLITQAAAQHPKGLVVTIPDAAVLSGPIKQAISAGIPVVVMNVGANVYQNVGGADVRRPGRDAAGQEAGQRDGRRRRAQGAVRHPRGAEHRPGRAVRRVRQGAGGPGRLGHDHPRQRGPAELGGDRDRERAEGRPQPSTGCSPPASSGSTRPAGRCSRWASSARSSSAPSTSRPRT